MTEVVLQGKGYRAISKECGTAETLAKHYRAIGCLVRVEGPARLVITGTAKRGS